MMTNHTAHRTAPLRGATASLLALVAMALGSDAAAPPATEPTPDVQALAHDLADRLRHADPAYDAKLPPVRLAQWRNY